MYTAKNTIKYIVEEAPEFQAYLDKIISEWTQDERTIGLDIGTFSDFISDKLEKDEKYKYLIY